jgi:hypothetical protein
MWRGLHCILSSKSSLGWKTLRKRTNSPNSITPFCFTSNNSKTCQANDTYLFLGRRWNEPKHRKTFKEPKTRHLRDQPNTHNTHPWIFFTRHIEWAKQHHELPETLIILKTHNPKPTPNIVQTCTTCKTRRAEIAQTQHCNRKTRSQGQRHNSSLRYPDGEKPSNDKPHNDRLDIVT